MMTEPNLDMIKAHSLYTAPLITGRRHVWGKVVGVNYS